MISLKKIKLTDFLFFLFILFCFIFFSIPSSAQEYKGTGGVRGYVSRMVLRDGRVFFVRCPQVTVELEFTSFKTSTDGEGRFMLKNIPAGQYILTIKDEKIPNTEKNILIKENKIFNIGNWSFYSPHCQILPPIIPGSLVALFEDYSKKEKNNISAVDSPLHRIIFYDPQTLNAYLEMGFEEVVERMVISPSGELLYVSDEKDNLWLFSLQDFSLRDKIKIPGKLGNIHLSCDESVFLLPYFTDKMSGVLMIEANTGKELKNYIPPYTGIIISCQAFSPQTPIFASLARDDGGRLIKIDPSSGIMTANRKVSLLPFDIALLKGERMENSKENKGKQGVQDTRGDIIVISDAMGKKIIGLDPDNFDILFQTPLEGIPTRITPGIRDRKIYVCVKDKNYLAVLTTEGNLISTIPVGDTPLSVRYQGNRIFVGNSGGNFISVIDARLDQLTANTEKENFKYLNDLGVVPMGKTY